ncbi:distal membrane-arm assembly complex protein 2 [Centropristis striata]|uniref:distal membrane-arm assembly complex protein 2 n=1 Tax=Centropristis striata TaxID=184440 RepID=UPI0027DFD86A|nr:distal membrane-arm assembly complex protein 2 [Centropristis striata]
MSAPLLSLHRCCQQTARLLISRRASWSSSSASSLPLHHRILSYLSQRFYDVEMFLSLKSVVTAKIIHMKNGQYDDFKREHGYDMLAPYFILKMKGRFRFVGQSEWFQAETGRKFNWAFMQHSGSLLEEVDVSYSIINHVGIMNMVGQKALRTLSVRGCPEVDDWFLSKLHEFQDSLEELDISHCPKITVGGLAALRNLKGLRRLDVSSLPRVSSPGLVVILLEEMLPQCHITAEGYDHSLTQEGEEEKEEKEAQRVL